MYDELYSLDEVINDIMRNNPTSVSTWLRGGTIGGVSVETMCNFWIISGRASNQRCREIIMRGKGGVKSPRFSRRCGEVGITTHLTGCAIWVVSLMKAYGNPSFKGIKSMSTCFFSAPPLGYLYQWSFRLLLILYLYFRAYDHGQ